MKKETGTEKRRSLYFSGAELFRAGKKREHFRGGMEELSPVRPERAPGIRRRAARIIGHFSALVFRRAQTLLGGRRFFAQPRGRFLFTAKNHDFRKNVVRDEQFVLPGDPEMTLMFGDKSHPAGADQTVAAAVKVAHLSEVFESDVAKGGPAKIDQNVEPRLPALMREQPVEALDERVAGKLSFANKNDVI
jgi:hypothetical protein